MSFDGNETLSVALRKEHILQMSENGLLEKISTPDKIEINVQFRILHKNMKQE
jgi:hypothetical protein